MSGTISAWPPSNGVTTKVVPRSSAILQLSHATTVHAPAALVFDAVLRVKDYPLWNTWVPCARIVKQEEVSSARDVDPSDFGTMRIGSILEFDVVMDAQKPNSINKTSLRVLDVSTPAAPSSYLPPALLEDACFTADLSKVYRVSWTGHGGMCAFGMSLERFHEVIIRGEDECELRTWEVMSGWLARVVKVMYEGTLRGKVELWCTDLKKYSEEQYEGVKKA
ncbi:hypothetical protein ACN47E_010228 [Coniothyrium glycines]